MPADSISLDTLGMFSATLNSGSQFLAGAQSAKGIGDELDSSRIQNIIIAGMGASGITGDLTYAATKTELGVPLSVVRSYELPAFVGDRTLALAISFSGGTQETLSVFDAALTSGAQVVAISTGGELLEKAATQSLPIAKMDAETPTLIKMPRAGLMAMFSAVLTILNSAGLISFTEKNAKAIAKHLEKRAAHFSSNNSPARELAVNIGRTLPLIKGAEGIGAVAARRWKVQINENAKTPAFYSELPEACHNELVGWGLNGDVTRQIFSLVQLRTDYEVAPVSAAFSIMEELEREVMSECYEVKAEGDSPIAQLLDLILFGDFVSLFIADLAGVDPGPIPAIDNFKQELNS